MSKQAMMFQQLLELSDTVFLWTMADWRANKENKDLFGEDKVEVIEAMLALAED